MKSDYIAESVNQLFSILHLIYCKYLLKRKGVLQNLII
ncbi:hypothetical protein NSP_37470 [Nodularia spumigena CCY9414]|nr:hypothetical protein NSP_37470 [Nodularia spumigena CCY9414]